MGTAKRERQKANRQLKMAELEKQQKRQKVKRRGLQFGIIIPVAVATLIGLVLILNSGDDNSSSSDTTTSAVPTSVGPTTLPEPTTTVAPTTTLAPLDCPKEDGSSTKTQTFPSPPPVCIDITKVYLAEVKTNKGSFTIELDPGIAPNTVNNFVYLARYHYFDATPCHRIIPSFVVQCGSPDGSGSGGPGYDFADELPVQGAYKLGSVVMANSGPDTNGSQMFVVTGDKGVALPPLYALFGQVTKGFDDTVKALEAAGSTGGTPTEPVTIESVTITEKAGAVATPTTVATTSTVATVTTVTPQTTLVVTTT